MEEQTRSARISWRRIPGFVDWFHAEAPSLTNGELVNSIGKKFGVDLSLKADMVHHLRRAYGGKQTPETTGRAYAAREFSGGSVPTPAFVRELGPKDSEYFVHVKGDCFVTSDWHLPYHKEELLHNLCRMAEAWRIKTLVINGDFLSQEAFSHHRRNRFQVNWTVEKTAARAVLERLFDVFDEIVYTLDNHDRRIIAAMEREFQEAFTGADVVELLTHGVRIKKLRPSVDYHYVVVNQTWRVTSPREYRRIKLSLPNRLAQINQQHIISGGDHLFGLGVDDSGTWIIANSLCMVDPARMPYKNLQDTTFPQWTSGFFMIRNNRLHVFPDLPAITDWEEAVKIGQLLTQPSRPQARR